MSVAFEIVGLGAQELSELFIRRREGAELGHQLLDLALVEFSLQAAGPALAGRRLEGEYAYGNKYAKYAEDCCRSLKCADRVRSKHAKNDHCRNE